MSNFADPAGATVYVAKTCDPELAQTTTPVTLSNTLHNLGLVLLQNTTVGVAFNVSAAPIGATHAWMALFSQTGSLVAVTADALAVQWSTGMQQFLWTFPVQGLGGLFYLDIVNNGATAPKLSGLNAFGPEVNFSAGNFPRWATNATAFPAGGGPPALVNPVSGGVPTLAGYALTGTNTAVTNGFFAGLI